jgi:hypothetical protein
MLPAPWICTTSTATTTHRHATESRIFNCLDLDLGLDLRQALYGSSGSLEKQVMKRGKPMTIGAGSGSGYGSLGSPEKQVMERGKPLIFYPTPTSGSMFEVRIGRRLEVTNYREFIYVVLFVTYGLSGLMVLFAVSIELMSKGTVNCYFCKL